MTPWTRLAYLAHVYIASQTNMAVPERAHTQNKQTKQTNKSTLVAWVLIKQNNHTKPANGSVAGQPVASSLLVSFKTASEFLTTGTQT